MTAKINTYSGIVQRGLAAGRELGFPTANIPLSDKNLSGIFAGSVFVDDREYHAAIFANQERGLLEAYLLDFEGELYGKEITMAPEKKIRDSAKFENEVDLRVAIAGDVEAARAYFKA